MIYVGNGCAVDAGDDDGPVASDAEAEALVVKFAQRGVARRVPLQLGREQSQRSQLLEQIRHRVHTKIRLSERQLQLGRSYKHYIHYS